jgi:hypothetical protein
MLSSPPIVVDGQIFTQNHHIPPRNWETTEQVEFQSWNQQYSGAQQSQSSPYPSHTVTITPNSQYQTPRNNLPSQRTPRSGYGDGKVFNINSPISINHNSHSSSMNGEPKQPYENSTHVTISSPLLTHTRLIYWRIPKSSTILLTPRLTARM